MRRAGRFIKMVCCGGLACLQKVSLDYLKGKKTGIFLATGLGNVDEIMPFITEVFKHGGGFPSPNQFANSVSNAAAFVLARICEVTGTVLTISQEELSFESALWLAQTYPMITEWTETPRRGPMRPRRYVTVGADVRLDPCRSSPRDQPLRHRGDVPGGRGGGGPASPAAVRQRATGPGGDPARRLHPAHPRLAAVAAIMALLGESGVSLGGARTAISRLTRWGVLEGSRQGRTVPTA